jgi:endonuclease/exonuclease/phosphatase family metal-dependent hydrolase
MRLAQWNVWYKERASRIVDTLREIDADFLCLQELTINAVEYNPSVDIPQLIASELGYHYFFKAADISTENGAETHFGNGIFSRHPICASSFSYIQEPPPLRVVPDYSEEARVYVECEVRVGDSVLTIGTIHMSYTDRFQPTPRKLAEAEVLVRVLKPKSNRYVFSGDLNALPDSKVVTDISSMLQDAGPSYDQKTWTTKPFSYQGFETSALEYRIDYCFTTPDITVTSAKVFKTDSSDHLPIVVEFDFI